MKRPIISTQALVLVGAVGLAAVTLGASPAQSVTDQLRAELATSNFANDRAAYGPGLISNTVAGGFAGAQKILDTTATGFWDVTIQNLGDQPVQLSLIDAGGTVSTLMSVRPGMSRGIGVSLSGGGALTVEFTGPPSRGLACWVIREH